MFPAIHGVVSQVLAATGGGGGGAFPIVGAVATTEVTSAVTTHPVNLPAGITPGDLLLVCFKTAYAGYLPTAPDGWALVAYRDVDATTAIFARTADGEEGATQDFVIEANLRGTHISVRITGGGSVEAAFAASSTYDPPSLSPSWGAAKTLWIAGASANKSHASNGINEGPATYGGFTIADLGTSTSSSRCHVAIASREAETSSEDPGSFGIGSGSYVDTPQAFTIAVQPA